MIDSHTHLYSEEFNNDLPQVMLRAKQTGISRFYLPAIDASTHSKMLETEINYPECYSMMGLHPCSVNATFESELKQVEDWLKKRSFAAIGEIGLDFYWDKTYTSEQYICFRRQIQLALEYDLPVVIHSRNATAETISVLKEFRGKKLRGIFHCFGGSLNEAEQITDLGFLLGIGGVVTYKNAGLAETLVNIDLHSLVLETDAPYLSPVPFRGKRNESSYLSYIVRKIADAKGVSEKEISDQTDKNVLALFNNYK